MIELTSAISETIKVGATVNVPVNETFVVPENAVGKFFVRLQLGEQGLTPPDSMFPPQFEGGPKKGIVLINNGANPIEIVKGRKIGTLAFLQLAVVPNTTVDSKSPGSLVKELQFIQSLLVR